MERLDAVAAELPIIFPIHPRTRANMAAAGIAPERVQLVDPLAYLEFLALVASARGVLTDSGGIQEETTYLGVPCFTLRDNTAADHCSMGTNVLLGLDPARIAELPRLLERPTGAGGVPPRWDGHAAERLVDDLRGRATFATLGTVG
jgi:UDP-N-acetylglucosamine 2-epimerase (non-hydrolysing)